MRDNLAQRAGWRVLRITYRMMIDQPGEVREMIRQALSGIPRLNLNAGMGLRARLLH